MSDWLPLGMSEYTHKEGYPHNIVLDCGIRFGIIGILAVLISVALGAFRYVQLVRKSTNAYLVALLLAGIFMFVVSLVSCHVFMLRATWLLMGVGLSPKPGTLNHRFRARTSSRRLAELSR
jgi:O-antigen ligase